MLKFNLKNRVSLRGKNLEAMTLVEKDNAILAYVQWFDGFEKELRERIPKIGWANSEKELLIKEILGES